MAAYKNPYETPVTEDDKLTIWHLYFDKLYDMDELLSHFKNKYSKYDIRRAINEKY